VSLVAVSAILLDWWAQPSPVYQGAVSKRSAAMKNQQSRSVPLILSSSAWKMCPVIHCLTLRCTEECWMHEGQNLSAVFSFGGRNGRVKGVVGGLEVNTCFLDREEAVSSNFHF